MSIDNYMTPNEASERWNINHYTIRNKLKPSLNKEEIEWMEEQGLIKSFIKKGGNRREWIITKKAMQQWFGEPRK